MYSCYCWKTIGGNRCLSLSVVFSPSSFPVASVFWRDSGWHEIGGPEFGGLRLRRTQWDEWRSRQHQMHRSKWQCRRRLRKPHDDSGSWLLSCRMYFGWFSYSLTTRAPRLLAMVIRPLDDPTYFARSPVVDLGIWTRHIFVTISNLIKVVRVGRKCFLGRHGLTDSCRPGISHCHCLFNRYFGCNYNEAIGSKIDTHVMH